MADQSNQEATCSQFFESIDENSIPGAALLKHPKQMNVQELRRWLSCRKGVSLKGLKPDLVKR